MADPAPDQVSAAAPPSAPAAPAPPPAAAATPAVPAQGTVTVRLNYPASSFATGIEGVEILTREPKQIPQGTLAALQEAAAISGVTVTEIKEQ